MIEMNNLLEKYKFNYNDLKKWNDTCGIKRAKFISTFIENPNIIKHSSKKISLLDIAGCFGPLRRFIPNSINYHIIDLVNNSFKNAIQWDLNKMPLPYKSKKFDIIVCLDLFNHLREPKKFLSEIKRILKDDGYIVLSLQKYKRGGGHLHILDRSFIEKEFKVIKEFGVLEWIFGVNITVITPLIRVPLFLSSERFYIAIKK
ncbi:MAG: methyltransferase domain-containing protein [Candidatus Aenigmarchaeota archaeon]|nr:methyltransferase domain-containing protein [Candidatus Aenigmarchaeota archaeon]